MQGLHIETKTTGKLPGVLQPAIDRFAARFWLIDVQAGPFSITDKSNFLELEAEIARYEIAVDTFENTSTSLWRPGILPRFSNLLVADEWTYLVALHGPEDEAVRVSRDLQQAGYLSARFFEFVHDKDAAFFVHFGGCWEVYSREVRDEWKERQGVSIIASDKWLEPR